MIECFCFHFSSMNCVIMLSNTNNYWILLFSLLGIRVLLDVKIKHSMNDQLMDGSSFCLFVHIPIVSSWQLKMEDTLAPPNLGIHINYFSYLLDTLSSFVVYVCLFVLFLFFFFVSVDCPNFSKSFEFPYPPPPISILETRKETLRSQIPRKLLDRKFKG
jgi:hypothetical protein